MKVCTDACLFGALVAGNMRDKKNVLDIGTGTGLLSLMYAQKNAGAQIDAVEIDKDAFGQAEENIKTSGWQERIRIFHQSIQDFSRQKEASYDLVISNPPFFENDMVSPNAQRNKALHASELTLKELVKTVSGLLKKDGVFCVLLPYARMQYFMGQTQVEKLHPVRQYLVRQTDKHGFFRCVLMLSKTGTETLSEAFPIKTNGAYSLRFTELLQDYYLHL